MQAVSIGKHHHAMPLLTQFMHDGDHFRAQRDKHRLPAVRELLVA
ncbi:Uncharacterised protein [Klebsiella pneumoniae]|nr:Uncharacterised protein [Klebsiella pneumoniae]SWL68067.1 Uncharacterised protein [Klebsiella pneumoniae]